MAYDDILVKIGTSTPARQHVSTRGEGDKGCVYRQAWQTHRSVDKRHAARQYVSTPEHAWEGDKGCVYRHHADASVGR